MKMLIGIVLLHLLIFAGTVGAAEADDPFFDLLNKRDVEGIAEAICNGQDVGVKNKDGNTALYALAANLRRINIVSGNACYIPSAQELQIVRMLLEAGADVREKHHKDNVTLLAAYAPLGPEFVELLLSAGADPNDEQHMALLFMSLSSRYLPPEKRLKTLKLLLAHGADVNAKFTAGQTVLSLASVVFRERPFEPETERELVKILLDAGADVNAVDDIGCTPLMNWAFMGRTATLRTLIDAGADVGATTKLGLTPLWWASISSSPDSEASMRLLIANGADARLLIRDDQTTLLHWPALLGNADKTAVLIEAGADVNDNRSGLAPLHVATGLSAGIGKDAEIPFEERVRLFFEESGVEGESAGNGYYLDTLKKLVAAGARTDVKSGVFTSELLTPSVIADIEAFYDKTPLEIARMIGNAEAERYLESLEKR